MTTLLLVGGLLALFAGVVGVLATVGAFGAERTQVSNTLAAIERTGPVPESMRQEVDKPFSERVIAPAGSRLTGIGRALTPSDWALRIRQRLDIAGNPPGWDADRVFAAKSAFALALGAIGGLVWVLGGLGFWGLIATIAAAVIGFFLPDIWLWDKGQKRTDAMRKALPDTMDMLSISVEAGLAFDGALAQVASQTTGPLADEIQRTLQEIQLGTDRTAAMRALAKRSRVEDLNYFVNAIAQAEVFGIPIAEVLKVQAAEMRIKRTQRAEEAAGKLPVKILFPLLFTILPATFIVILGPAVLSIAKVVDAL